jgi:hypothetical protein
VGDALDIGDETQGWAQARLAQQALPRGAGGPDGRLGRGWRGAIKMMRIEQPAAYVRVMCSILPKELIFENSTITELDDAELDHMIEMLRERALAVRQEQAALEKVPEPKLLNG